jgi:hypothetical protein
MTVVQHTPEDAHVGWSAAEIAADQALAASIRALGQADGLLSPALESIFQRHVKASPAPTSKGQRRGPQSHG